MMDSLIHKSFNINILTFKMIRNDKFFTRIMENSKPMQSSASQGAEIKGKVKVLINGLHARTGGGVTYLRHMLPILADDPELELHLCLHPSQLSLFEPVPGGVTVHQAGFRDGFYRRLIWEQTALPGLARRLGARVTFSPANFGPLRAPGQVILLRNALDVSAEEARFSKRLYWWALSFMTRASLSRCAHAIAVSGYAAEALSRGRYKSLNDRITVIHHGVGEEFSPPGLGEDRDEFLLSVGDIYIQKNLHRLIEALARVRDVFPDVVLKVAGRRVDGQYAGRIGSLVASLGLEGNVELLGHVGTPELAGLYRRCAIFVFPSTVETFGNPLIEAMKSGAPVLSSNAAAMPEVLGGASMVFDPRDPEAIAARIIEALGYKDLRRLLSKKSLDRANSFSWKVTGEKTAEVLKKCV